ncbi:beta-ketoacyl synthase N-terminal-like domain-containing protein [Streptomyces radiopugnans]|uniref:Beta-ketoacyl synthase, N-terminal domain n=1 Tax=Streptomyces radiopugnans TaxID=403935 RepID=A0A1H9JFR6_9ACTN|nr:beta-ketoacyl synthase N-terminal-like domain-containing protein [Streptomyces radiopugnans]SEQ85670.1 Beta-ketoacyl synthase, N-terminal domain [Streptomyces radiopugnans]
MTVLITAAGAVAEEPRPAEGDGTGAAAWFDPAAHLGRRGWKYLSPATRYLLAAGNQALGRRHDEPPLTGAPAERFGVVTGTQYAIAGVHRRMDDTLATTGVQGISPAEVPAFSMNTPGSQLAISTGARAFSVTLTNPVTAGLEAVQFAVTALRTGRADRVVAAAADQVPAGDDGRDRYDAAAAVVLSRDPAPVSGEGVGVLAGITGGISRFVPRGADGDRDPAALAASCGRVAALAGGARNVRLVVSGPAAAAEFGGAVRDAVVESLAEAGGSVRDPAGAVSRARHCAVSGLLELIALARTGGTGLVVSVSESGHLTAIALDAPVQSEFH